MEIPIMTCTTGNVFTIAVNLWSESMALLFSLQVFTTNLGSLLAHEVRHASYNITQDTKGGRPE